MERRRTFFLSLLLFLGTMVLYWPVSDYEFVYIDDNLYVTQNPWVQQGLSWANLKWAFTSTYAFNWHPLTWLSHMFDYTVFGSFAGGHHLTNVTLHGVNTLLLFFLLKRLAGSFWPCALVAALFAWHPLHVESVAWVAERKDVLSTLFLLLTISAYGRYARLPTKLRYGLALVWFALGLMVKPMLVTLPCILLLLDYWPLNRFPRLDDKLKARRIYLKLFIEKLPFFALSLAACVITVYAQKQALKNLVDVPYSLRLLNSLTAYLDYLRTTFIPVNLCVYYPLPSHIPIFYGILAALILGGISYLVFCWRSRCPSMIVGWFWFLGTLVPVIGLVQVGEQARADRYTYIPLIGLFVMLVWGLDYWLRIRKVTRSFKFGITLILLISCLLATRYQLMFWRDNFSLFARALAVTKDNALANQNLAIAFSHADKPAAAIPHYKEVLRLKPDHMSIRYDLGVQLVFLGRTDEAIFHFSEALKQGSRSEKLHNNLGVLFSEKEQLDLASNHLKQAIQINPNFPDPYMNYALVLQKQGLAGQAVTNYIKSLQLNPDLPGALSKYGFLLATCPDQKWRDSVAAVKMAERATKITRHQLENRLETLAAVYGTLGRFSDAIAAAELARKMAHEKGRGFMVQRLDRDLESYRIRKNPPRDWQNPP